jgi:hypothetical protein
MTTPGTYSEIVCSLWYKLEAAVHIKGVILNAIRDRHLISSPHSSMGQHLFEIGCLSPNLQLMKTAIGPDFFVFSP